MFADDLLTQEAAAAVSRTKFGMTVEGPKPCRSNQPCVMASGTRGYVYVGVTSDLLRRVHEHCTGLRSGWAHEKSCVRLVRYEMFGDMERAIAREKQIKNWHRPWKLNLVEENNLHWQDLAVRLGFDPLPE